MIPRGPMADRPPGAPPQNAGFVGIPPRQFNEKMSGAAKIQPVSKGFKSSDGCKVGPAKNHVACSLSAPIERLPEERDGCLSIRVLESSLLGTIKRLLCLWVAGSNKEGCTNYDPILDSVRSSLSQSDASEIMKSCIPLGATDLSINGYCSVKDDYLLRLRCGEDMSKSECTLYITNFIRRCTNDSQMILTTSQNTPIHSQSSFTSTTDSSHSDYSTVKLHGLFNNYTAFKEASKSLIRSIEYVLIHYRGVVNSSSKYEAEKSFNPGDNLKLACHIILLNLLNKCKQALLDFKSRFSYFYNKRNTGER